MHALGGWLVYSLALVAAPGEGTLVVVLDGAPTTLAAAEAVLRTTPDALRLTEVVERLAPGRRVDEPDLEALERVLADALEHDARFEAAAATALRESIVRTYQTSLRPTEALATLAARALHDSSAAATADGRTQDARRHAAEAVRRFGHVGVDATRIPPTALEVFRRIAPEQARAPRFRLDVTTPVPGTLVVDGRPMEEAGARPSALLAPGRYRVWLVAGGRRSFARDVEVIDAPVSLSFDPEVEWALTLAQGPLPFACGASCAELLLRLGQRARVTTVLALARANGDEDVTKVLEVRVATGTPTERLWTAPGLALAPPRLIAAPVAAPQSRPAFSWWYVVPGGVGQFHQGRPLVGSAVVATQAGLLAWHALAVRDHREASGDPRIEPDYRETRNLSASLFWGAIAAGVIEALVVGAVTGE